MPAFLSDSLVEALHAAATAAPALPDDVVARLRDALAPRTESQGDDEA